jgi:hypothetical protein
MSYQLRCSIGILAMLAAVAFIVVPVKAQTPASRAFSVRDWTPPRTPWGDPDLQGIYTSDDYIGVPLQRPSELGTRLFLTKEEMVAREALIAKRAAADLQESLGDAGRAGTGPPGNWSESAKRSPRQTSLVIDPPDGTIPRLTPEGEDMAEWAAANRQSANTAEPADSWENYTVYIRCITRGVAGSIFPVGVFPVGYGNGTQILQAPGYIVIFHEMVHEARVIPLDGRPHSGSGIRSYMGDSRGRWEGHTLVVETRNFIPNATGIESNGSGVRPLSPPTSDQLRLTERFTRTDPETIYYELTINDPKRYTRPWTVAFAIRQESGYQLFEYGCHEGNHGMTNQLSAARAMEKAAREADDRK